MKRWMESILISMLISVAGCKAPSGAELNGGIRVSVVGDARGFDLSNKVASSIPGAMFDPTSGDIGVFIGSILRKWDTIPQTAVFYLVREERSNLSAVVYTQTDHYIAELLRGNKPTGTLIVVSRGGGEAKLFKNRSPPE